MYICFSDEIEKILDDVNVGCRLLLLLLFAKSLQLVHMPQMSVLALTAQSAVVEVVLVSHAHLLRLVANQTDRSADFGSHGSLEATLAQKAVDRLDLIPTCNSMVTSLVDDTNIHH